MTDVIAGPETAEANWIKVAEVGEPAEGRVMTVTAGTRSIALTCYQGRVGALDNHCPHQGGPLGEGTIERGLLRCPGTATTTTRSTDGHRAASATTPRRSPST